MLYYIRKWFFHNKTQGSLLASLGVGILLALFSYHHDDPSFNVAIHKTPSNLLQYFGSYLSDLLYQFLGLASFLLPAAMIVYGVVLYRRGELRLLFVKLLILISATIGVAVSLSQFTINVLPAGCGGAIGIILSPLILKYGVFAQICLFILSISVFILSLGVNLKILVSIVDSLVSYMRQRFIKSFLCANTSTPKRRRPILTEGDKEMDLDIIADIRQHETTSKFRDDVNMIPPIELLRRSDNNYIKIENASELKKHCESLLKVLGDFGVKGQIIDVSQGPVVTLYEFEPAAGTKSSRVIGLSDDIARSLSAVSTRIAIITGRNALGVELPNKQRAFFCLRELIETPEYRDHNISLPLVLGKDLSGKPFVADLAKMPHLLVAGTTGAGKSVAINAMILSLLYRYTPAECRLIMIDPKMLELSVYDHIPHLLTPVVTEPSKAIIALKWAVREMENRYRLMSNISVRNITGYNAKIADAIANGTQLSRTVQTGFDPETGTPIYESVAMNMTKLPFIVVIVDEMADLMITAGKDIESSIQRLAQMARAAGIHIIMATQRPSVDVITGVIKANFPSRISFKVTSKIDSRTILGEQGAEQLLGMGDMLYMGNASKITRVHGPFVDDAEVEKIAQYLRSLASPEYISAVTQTQEEDDDIDTMNIDIGNDDNAIYKKALQIVKSERKVSTSYIQRCLRIGYNRAADIVDKMEREGIITPPNTSGKREILLPED